MAASPILSQTPYLILRNLKIENPILQAQVSVNFSNRPTMQLASPAGYDPC